MHYADYKRKSADSKSLLEKRYEYRRNVRNENENVSHISTVTGHQKGSGARPIQRTAEQTDWQHFGLLTLYSEKTGLDPTNMPKLYTYADHLEMMQIWFKKLYSNINQKHKITRKVWRLGYWIPRRVEKL